MQVSSLFNMARLGVSAFTSGWLYPAIAGIGLAILAATYVKGRMDGHAIASVEAAEDAVKASERLREREREIRDRERDLAHRLSTRAHELQVQHEKLQVLTGELAREAADDPDADRPALNADSIRRLNRY